MNHRDADGMDAATFRLVVTAKRQTPSHSDMSVKDQVCTLHRYMLLLQRSIFMSREH